VNGSPLVFLTAAARHQQQYKADLIEIEKENLESLKRNMPRPYHGRVEYHLGDYRTVIPQLLPEQDESDFGLLFIDPSNGLPDFQTVTYVAQMRPKMETLIGTLSDE
jgi:23S rRNA A2030 N6-methylase RlmJ